MMQSLSHTSHLITVAFGVVARGYIGWNDNIDLNCMSILEFEEVTDMVVSYLQANGMNRSADAITQ